MKNKIIAAILTIVLICSSASILSFANGFLLGDVNGDGKHTASDARMALRIAASIDNPTDEQRVAADVNGDNRVTASDARTILRWSAKIETPPTAAPGSSETTGGSGNQDPTTTEPSTPDVTKPSEPAETTTPDNNETTTDNAGQVVDKYPKAIDAFFRGKFYMEAALSDGNVNETIKFATNTNSRGESSVEIVMPIEGLDVSIYMANDGNTYMKLIDSKNKKYYANLTELMNMFSQMTGEEFDIDFSYLLKGVSFSIIKDYGKPVLTKESNNGVEYDVYTFSIDDNHVAFYAVNGQIKGIKNIYPDGEESYMEVIVLSETIPSNMLTTRGFDENIPQIIAVLNSLI